MGETTLSRSTSSITNTFKFVDLFPDPSWPRLIVTVCFWILATWYVQKNLYSNRGDEWECYATTQKRPNGEGRGMNVSAQFDKALGYEYVLCWIATFCYLFKLSSKFLPSLNKWKVFVGIIKACFNFVALAWMVWASIIRFRHEGKLCAGTLNNINATTFPYAYDDGQGLYMSLFFSWSLFIILTIVDYFKCI